MKTIYGHKVRSFIMNIHEIEQAITELSPDELARFREWFGKFDAQVQSGKLTTLQPMTEEHLDNLRGSLKGKGALKVLMDERRKE
jgi:hypothetical protein